MLKLLGLIDIFATVLLLLIVFNIEIPAAVLIIVSSALFLKASIYVIDAGSFTDIIVAILIVLNLFVILPFWILLPGAILIGIKGFMSLSV